MARRRIIEGTWTCTSCDTTGIKGRHKACPACGNPREQEEAQFDFGERTGTGASTADTVANDAALALAAAGEDWVCANCDASNRGDRTVCRTCSASKDDPFGEPVFEPLADPPARHTGKVAAGGIAGIGAAIVAAVGSVCSCCGFGWFVSDATVDAQVQQTQWVRQVQVERLTPSDVVMWRDALPAAAGVPGSGRLAEGTGTIGDCETLACWPRPPDGGTTARVNRRRWERVIETDVMRRSDESGWRSAVPSAAGSMPVAGQGGREGYVDLSCSRREKTPEQCRDVAREVQCGTTESCTVNDLGNGFAEEVCVDVPQYCTEYEQQCDAAVYEDWCTWTELEWASGRRTAVDGTDDAPRWPLLSLRSDERERRTESYTLDVTALAGEPVTQLTTTESVFATVRVGTLVSNGPSGVLRLADALQIQDTDRHDCGDGIPMGVLTTRDRCAAEVWSWVAEDPLRATGDEGAPAWPDGQLGQDGRESREEWMLVELEYARRSTDGHVVFRDDVDRWSDWQDVDTVPVVVDFDAVFQHIDEEWDGPRPEAARAGRINDAP